MYLRTLILVFLLQAISSCDKEYDPLDLDDRFTGIDRTDRSLSSGIDSIISAYMTAYEYISVGIVMDEEIVLTRSYNQDRLGKKDVYASVTKPLTSMIVLEMMEEGIIGCVEDPVDEYSTTYVDVMPEECENSNLTFQNLLSHESGIPHHDRIWESGKLALEFCPGTGFHYSTRGYGVLGDILCEVSGKSYGTPVDEYIEERIDASSFSVPGFLFEAPGGLVSSSIYDMSLFAQGVMDGTLVSQSVLRDLAWVPWAKDGDQDVGLGWYLVNTGTDSLGVYHAGSNGKPRAFIALRPLSGIGVVLLGKNWDTDGSQQFYALSREILQYCISRR